MSIEFSVLSYDLCASCRVDTIEEPAEATTTLIDVNLAGNYIDQENLNQTKNAWLCDG